MENTAGILLKEAREKQGLSIADVSEATYIRKHILTAIEEGDFSVLPAAAQVKGFIRAYAEYLGLNGEEILLSLRQGDVIPQEGSNNSEALETSAEIKVKDSTTQMYEIFKEIGGSIQQQRDILGLSLEEIEAHTHIPINYLNLLENGAFHQFPSPMQARGMLGNYASFLGMSKNAVLIRYAEALQSKLAQDQLEKIRQQEEKRKSKTKIVMPIWLRNVLSADSLIFGTLGIATLIFAIWGVSRVLDIQAKQEPQPTAPALSGLLLPSATSVPAASATSSQPGQFPIATDAIVLETESLEPTLLPFSGENINLFVIVNERTYLRVTVDGQISFDGRVAAGANLPYTANQSIEVLTGNAAALEIIFNGSNLGPLGLTGEVVNYIYTRSGIVAPTPTITPTIDPDSITQTLTPTPGITPSQTPTPAE